MNTTGQGPREKGTVARMVDRLSKQDFSALTRTDNVPSRVNSGAGDVGFVGDGENSSIGGVEGVNGSKIEPKEYAVVRFSYTAQQEDELDLKEGDELAILELVEDGWARGCILQSVIAPDNKGRTGLYPTNFVSTVSSTFTSQTTPVTTHCDRASNSHLQEGTQQSYENSLTVSASAPKSTTTAAELSNDSGVVRAGTVLRSSLIRNAPGTGLTSPIDSGTTRRVVSSVITPTPTTEIATTPNEQSNEQPTRQKSKEFARVLYKYEATNPDELTLTEGAVVTVIKRECDDEGWFVAEHEGRRGLFPDNFVRFLEHEHLQSSANSQPPLLPAKPMKIGGGNNPSVITTTTGIGHNTGTVPIVSARDSLMSGNMKTNEQAEPPKSTIETAVKSSLDNTNNSVNRRSMIEGLQKQLFPKGKLPPQRPPQPQQQNLSGNRSPTIENAQIEPKMNDETSPAAKLLISNSSIIKSRTNIAPSNKRPPSKLNSALLLSSGASSTDSCSPTIISNSNLPPATTASNVKQLIAPSSLAKSDSIPNSSSPTATGSSPSIALREEQQRHASSSSTAKQTRAPAQSPQAPDNSQWISRIEFEHYKEEQERKIAELRKELDELRGNQNK